MSNRNGQEMTGAQALIAALEDTGVETIFGYPGGQAIRIYDALYDSKMHHVLVRHEQGATHAADGYARATGKTGTVIVTSGPGATNTVTGIATAYMDSIPMVVICGQVPLSALGSDAFQESDITGITMPIVKHSYLVRDANKIAQTVAEAYHVASTGRPGPVVIDMPSNLLTETVTYSYPDEVKLQSYKPTYKGNTKQVKQAVAELTSASKPVIYCGGGVLWSHACKDLMQLSETLQIPCVVSLMAKGVYNEDKDLCLGLVGMHGSRAANMALYESDLIFAVGTRFADRVTGALDKFAPNARVVHVDIDPAEIGKNRAVDVPIVGDAKIVLSAINEELELKKPALKTGEWVERVMQWKKESPFFYEKREDAILPEQVIDELCRASKDRDTIYTTEDGQHQMWAAQYLTCTRSRTFISSGGAGTMGFGLPAAMGAQMGKPESRVVCIAGDGSVQMNIQEMATIRENNLPVKLVILDNNCLGMVHQWQQLFYDQRYSNTIFSCNPDFVQLAQAYGWQAKGISKPAELADALKEMLDSDQPYMLHVKIPASENVYPMIPGGKAVTDMIGAVILDEDGNKIEKEA